MIPQRITDQYHQFCSETNITLFSTSTMLRILSLCTATVRKSLHGLDYFAAGGVKAFEDKVATVEKQGEGQWVHRCQQALKEGKQYFKTDYKVVLPCFMFPAIIHVGRGVYLFRLKCRRQGTYPGRTLLFKFYLASKTLKLQTENLSIQL